MQLTKTLLKLDFDLEIELPQDRLCPPVIHRWDLLEDLMLTQARYPTATTISSGSRTFSILLCQMTLLTRLSGWTLGPEQVASILCWDVLSDHGRLSLRVSAHDVFFLRSKLTFPDIDPESLKYARRNIDLNGLTSRINLVDRQPSDKLIPTSQLPPTLDFTMTNPPFYSSDDELSASAAKKSLAPSTACTGAPVEMVTAGGEVTFVTRIIEESLVLKERVTWYTAMVGFLSSLTSLVERLKGEGVGNYAVTEFVQGSKTRRWALAWSFGARRPEERVVRGVNAQSLAKSVLPPSTQIKFVEAVPAEELGLFIESLIEKIEELDLESWNWDRQALEGIGKAPDKVWARAWRRMKKRQEAGDLPTAIETRDDKKSLGFKITIRVQRDESVEVMCRWLEGHDAAVFESFGGFLKAMIESARGRQREGK